jgi:pimeloyl-ACP methyl ester carboxylesterase
MMTTDKPPILLIHGLWLTPHSWSNFRGYYASRGHEVLTPAWPHLEGAVEDIRRDPSPLDGLGITEIVDHYDAIIRSLQTPPILMGHSFGGLCVQLLLDRGLGAAAVAIDAAAPRGVLRLPLSQARSMWPMLKNPANRTRTVALSFEQFRYAFANNMSEQDARAAYDAEAIPSPGRPVFQAAFAAFAPHAATKVNYRNDTRAPLLFIAGGEDHTVPPAVNKANHRKYRHSAAVTQYLEFPGRSHLTVSQPGWEEVAEKALSWAQSQIGAPVANLKAQKAEEPLTQREAAL